MKANQITRQRKRAHAEAQRQALLEAMRRDSVQRALASNPNQPDEHIARACHCDIELVQQMRMEFAS